MGKKQVQTEIGKLKIKNPSWSAGAKWTTNTIVVVIKRFFLDPHSNRTLLPPRCELQLSETTDHYGVIIRANRGFTSTTKVYEIAEYFQKLSDKSINVFYLGDHDPSGITIQEELYSRLKEYGTPYFEMTRLAIHKADIELFNLPPLRIKDSDTRAKKFRQNYGEDCVELDALPPNELRNRIENAIRGCIEFESWDRAEKASRNGFYCGNLWAIP